MPTWHADAAVALRASGVPEKEIADALKNFWKPARRAFTDPEIESVVRWQGQWFREQGKSWNPARVWNPRNQEFSERFRWAISRTRDKQKRSPTKGIATVRAIIMGETP